MRYEKKVQLKNGEYVILRNPTGKDAEAILAHMILTSGETDYMLRYPDEIKMVACEEERYLCAMESRSDAIMIAAFYDGKIIANAGFNPVSRFDKCKHRAEFGISIQKDYWGLGIGSRIMEAILETARHAGYRQIELDVVGDNTQAIALYEKYDFVIIGTNERAFRKRNGEYQSLHTMVYKL